MAILLRRSVRSSWVPQAACDSVKRPEPPTEEAAVKGRHVHGSGGRHQVASPLSLSPLTTLIAAILSDGQAVRKMRDGWRQPHLQQPFGGP